ncbi:MAG: hypothetical protein LBV40_05705 [Methanomicrobiales archaeon]|jgi:hypothetical protein|nr:hypothetical protein [Methanomicrobiales archaeon]
MKKLAEEDACIGTAVRTLKIMSADENAIYEEKSRHKFLWDQEVRKRKAEERGREEGIEIGEKKGSIKTAKAMIEAGVYHNLWGRL